MLFLAVALYFLLACFVAWLVLFPSGRELVAQRLAHAGGRLDGRLTRWKSSAGSGWQSFKQVSKEWGVDAIAYIRRNLVFCALGLCVALIPPLLALTLGGKFVGDEFDGSTREINEQVAELLKGEHLVPPAPLPPMLFTTAEVVAVRPMLVNASRNWQLLNPEFAQRLLLVFKIMQEKHGYEMAILEGYRSPERQNMLASMGSHVTNAAAFQSYHQFGLAADCAFLRDGKLVISEKDPWAMRGYQLYGQVAESVGLTWGGNWKMMDFGHTELRKAGVIKK